MTEYRSIPEFPGYRIGSDGSVWSCWEISENYGSAGKKGVRYRKGKRWRRMKTSISSHGYLCFNMRREGKTYTRYVHRMMLLAFCGSPPPGKPMCLHGNDDKQDNRLENLRWGSPQDNMDDKRRNGGLTRAVEKRRETMRLKKWTG